MSDLEETLVAALMMRPGLDATMIGPIEHVQRDDTDFLCVSSFNHSFAILSWLTAEDLDGEWRRLGLVGEIVNPGFDGRPAADGVRRIYHLRLVPSLIVEEAVEQLSQILTDRNVKTVSIGLPGLSGDRESPGNNMSPAGKKVAQTAGDQADQALPGKAEKKPAGEITAKPGSVAAVPDQPFLTHDATPDGEPEWEHLEKLVDDFDSLDL